jgi:hypothetical protein
MTRLRFITGENEISIDGCGGVGVGFRANVLVGERKKV